MRFLLVAAVLCVVCVGCAALDAALLGSEPDAAAPGLSAGERMAALEDAFRRAQGLGSALPGPVGDVVEYGGWLGTLFFGGLAEYHRRKKNKARRTGDTYLASAKDATAERERRAAQVRRLMSALGATAKGFDAAADKLPADAEQALTTLKRGMFEAQRDARVLDLVNDVRTEQIKAPAG